MIISIWAFELLIIRLLDFT